MPSSDPGFVMRSPLRTQTPRRAWSHDYTHARKQVLLNVHEVVSMQCAALLE